MIKSLNLNRTEYPFFVLITSAPIKFSSDTFLILCYSCNILLLFCLFVSTGVLRLKIFNKTMPECYADNTVKFHLLKIEGGTVLEVITTTTNYCWYFNLPRKTPNNAAYRQSRSNEKNIETRHVNSPAIMADTLWISIGSAHGLSASSPAAKRPRVLHTPSTDRIRLAFALGTLTSSTAFS